MHFDLAQFCVEFFLRLTHFVLAYLDVKYLRFAYFDLAHFDIEFFHALRILISLTLNFFMPCAFRFGVL